MADVTTIHPQWDANAEHVDVLIIGAGISGIGAAHHLLEQCPGKGFLMLESKASFGGTWHTHTYPGIRSDSDLFTFGYRFKPWTGAPVATAPAILNYLEEVVQEDQLAQYIRYHHEILSASWDSEQQHWYLRVRRSDTDETLGFTCTYLWMCGGYYQHAQGFTPEWDGMADFSGQIVHPQTWPEDLDYSGKRVVVIGSGATAATLIPNMADECAHITMLQRSPTYFATGENRNELADTLRDLDIPEEWIHEIVRRSILKMTKDFQDLTAEQPEKVKAELIKNLQTLLPDDYDMSHFTPSYRPWQQRLAYTPDGDLFNAIKAGKVSVVTDHIDRFTPDGVLTQSGELLKADIIVTATGFNPSLMADIAYDVDGKDVDFANSYTYRGVMISGVPNLFQVFGSLRTTYTIRVELICDFVCRLFNHMDAIDATVCTPTLSEQEQDMPKRLWVDPEEFKPTYLQRILPRLPKHGDHQPWTFNTDYYIEREELPAVDLNEAALVYVPAKTGVAASQ